MNSTPNGKLRSNIKLIIIGKNDVSVPFINKWRNITSKDDDDSIISNFGFKIYNYKGNLYKIFLNQAIGKEPNQQWVNSATRDTHGLIFIGNATTPESIEFVLEWKKLFENNKFIDDKPLPCILVENNIDLLPQEEQMNDSKLKLIGEKYKFDKVYRVSSTKGININESMDFLIQLIIQRLEIFASSINDNDIFSSERRKK